MEARWRSRARAIWDGLNSGLSAECRLIRDLPVVPVMSSARECRKIDMHRRRQHLAEAIRIALVVAVVAHESGLANEGAAAAPTSFAFSTQDVKNAALFKEILFRATYDDSVEPTIHNGNPKARTKGAVAFEKGRFGKAIAVGDAFTNLTYTLGSSGHPVNMNCRHGSVSFHFKAVNWEPSEKRSHLLFHVTRLALLRVFTDQDGMLVFQTGTDLGQCNTVKASLADKKEGEWIHVVATWSREEIRLYVDGELAARKDNEDRFLSYALNTTFEIGDLPRAMGREGERKTLIDELTIYRRPLAEDELFRAQAPESAGDAPAYEPPAVAIPRASKSPAVDGVFTAGEWLVAAELTNFSSVSDHKLAPVQTRAYVTYDEKHLYFAVRSAVLPGVEPTAQCRQRDDHVWRDDSTQIYITVPSGDRFHFVGNLLGTIFDRRYEKGINADIGWNGDWKFANTVQDGVWTAEVSLSFAEMGVDPPVAGEAWRMNVTRDRVEPQNLSAWPAQGGYSETPKHGTLVFTGRSPVVTTAPSCEGIIGDQVDVAAELSGAAIDQPTDVRIEWVLAADGKLLLAEREDVRLAPGQSASVALKRTLDVAPDALVFTAKQKQANRTLYHHSVSFSRRDLMAIALSPLPSAGVCRVSLKIADAGVAAMQPTACIDLLASAGDRPSVTINIREFDKGRGGAQFNLNDLAPGDYVVRAELRARGKVLGTLLDTFTKPHEPWRGSKLGASDTPPPPWPPIELSRKSDGAVTVKCWNRGYIFRGTPMPSVIKNGSDHVLAAPIEIRAKADGENQIWKPGQSRIVARDKKKVTVQTTRISQALSMQAQTTTEFDGMIWTQITLTPNKAIQLETLDLIVPIKGHYAKYRHWPGEVALTGNMGREDGWHWTSSLPERNYLWLGNDDLGLTWFFETMGQFQHADENSVLELARQDGVLYLKIHYVGKPVTLTEPQELAFGIQATPTRTRTRRWRSRGNGNILGAHVQEFGRSEELTRYGSGHPEPANLDYYRRYVKALQDNGWRATPFCLITWRAAFAPEMQYNVADWDLGGGYIKYSEFRKFWWGRVLCSEAQSYRDYINWKAQKFLEDTGADGLYHDLQWYSRCGNTSHGPGETHRSIRADRDLNMRLYTIMKTQFDRPLLKWDHASGLVCSLTSPFSDLFLTGEEMRRYPPEGKHPDHKVRGNYFHNMRLDYFKACGATGRQWGVAPMFLTQMTESGPGNTDALYSILLAHDAIPISEALWRDVSTMRRVQRTLEEFGIGADDVEFLPYWHDGTPAKVSFTPQGGGDLRPIQVEYEVPDESRLRPEESVGASIYCRQGKRSLIAVFNYTQDDGVADLKIDLDTLGLGGERVLVADAFSRLAWTQVRGILAVPVKSLSFRLLWLESLDAIEYGKARIIDSFPPYPQEKMVAGYKPGNPFGERTGMEIAGDIRKSPWRNTDAPFTGAQRTELAQVFSIDKPCTVHRIDVYLKDSDGAFALRKPIQVRLVKVADDSVPTQDQIISTDQFAPIEADARTWRYQHFELLRSVKLDAGKYALVFTKPAEDLSEFFHTQFVAVSAKKLPGACVAHRQTPAWDKQGMTWKKDPDKVLCFGVYGYDAVDEAF
jgi:hypothetical protein